jgi:hypothetical protein
LCIAQQVDDAMLGVAEKNAVAIGEQMQFAASRGKIGETVAEVATQKGHHATDTLEAESAAAQVTEHGQFSEVFE